VAPFLKRIEEAGFWNTPSVDNSRIMNDGAQWIVEGLKGGTYHLVDRQSPENGVAWELGRMFLFELAKLKLPKDEIY